MPRSKTNSNDWVAGALPIVSINDQQYFVDGRLEQLRNVNNFMDAIDCVDEDVWSLLSAQDKSIVCYEFMGETI